MVDRLPIGTALEQRRLDELHPLKWPFLGARKLRDLLNKDGFDVGRKHVGALMRKMDISAVYRKPKTSTPGNGPEHRVYPYLLRNLAIERANHVWAADISYLPMAKGFLYLVAIMDWASSARVLSPQIAASATFALNAPEWFGRFMPCSCQNTSNGSSSITYRPVQFSGTSSCLGLRQTGKTK
jgi:putative transposase